MTPARIKFLISLGNLIKTGGIKRFKEALAFARRQFGEIDDAFFNDILNVFRKEGKTKKGDVVPIKKNPLEEVIDKKFGKDTYKKSLVRRPEEFATRKEYEKYLDETLGPGDDVFGSPMKDDLLKEWDKVNAKNVTPKDEGIPNVLTKKQKDKLDNFFDKILKKQKKEKLKAKDVTPKMTGDENLDYDWVETSEGWVKKPGSEGAFDRFGKENKELIDKGIKNIKTDEAKDIKKVIDEKEGDDFIDFVRKSGDEEGANKIQKEVDRLNKAIEDADKRVRNTDRLNFIPGGNRYAEGNVRTAVRQFMRSEADAGKLKLSKDDYDALQVYGQTTESDPIDIFRRYYGEDALDAADAMADKLQYGESFSHYEEIFRKNMPDLKVKVKGVGEYDDSVKAGEELRLLDQFDPKGRKPNAEGGLIDILKL